MSDSEKWQNWYEEYKQSGAIEAMRKAEAEKREALKEKQCSECGKMLPISSFHAKKRKRKDGSTYKGYVAKCKTCRNTDHKTYRKENSDVVKAYNKTPQRKAAARERNRLKDIRKSHPAVPNWITAEHRKAIRAIYLHAADCRTVTGEEYHVDHIVPLKGETVCGLHVPWNLQVLPADVNTSKSNKWHWGRMDQ